MKVGTDGVLLGAWAPIRGATRILDVGTGCGIVALMLAQRTAEIESYIAAIEIDHEAATQAFENFEASPWPNRLPQSSGEVHLSLKQFFSCQESRQSKIDLAVCNPPFFSASSPASDEPRNVARHCGSLSRELLFQQTRMLLAETGRLCLVLPFEQADETMELSQSTGFRLLSRVDVRPNPQSEAKRVLLEFGPQADCNPPTKMELVIETARHQYSADYAELTKDFHLRYAEYRSRIR